MSNYLLFHHRRFHSINIIYILSLTIYVYRDWRILYIEWRLNAFCFQRKLIGTLASKILERARPWFPVSSLVILRRWRHFFPQKFPRINHAAVYSNVNTEATRAWFPLVPVCKSRSRPRRKFEFANARHYPIVHTSSAKLIVAFFAITQKA